MNRSLFVPMLALALLLETAPAAGQDWRSSRPYRGLFGSGIEDAGQSLVITGSIGGAYVDNVIDETDAPSESEASDLNTTFRGGIGQVSAALLYSLNTGRASLGAAASTSVGYYPALDDEFLRRDQASLSARYQLLRNLEARAFAAYQPYSLAGVFPTLFDVGPSFVASPDIDFASSREHYFGYGGALEFTHHLSRRTRASASYSYRGRSSSGNAEQFGSHSAGGRLLHDVGRDLTLRAGYRISQGRYGADDKSYHYIDAGADYRKALSFSRRTTLSFGSGTTATARPEVDGGGTRFRLNGNVRLNHEFGRTWHGSLAYGRGVQFIESWPEPLFLDSITARFGGLLSRRVEFGASARAANGGSFTQTAGVDTFYANAGISVALARYASLGFGYSYYKHQFGAAIARAPGFSGELQRHGVRAALNLWAPLFTK